MDRRTGFFLGAAALCYAMIPIAEAKYRWVAIAIGTVYVVLAILAWFDLRTRSKLEPRRPAPTEPVAPAAVAAELPQDEPVAG